MQKKLSAIFLCMLFLVCISSTVFSASNRDKRQARIHLRRGLRYKKRANKKVKKEPKLRKYYKLGLRHLHKAKTLYHKKRFAPSIHYSKKAITYSEKASVLFEDILSEISKISKKEEEDSEKAEEESEKESEEEKDEVEAEGR